VTTAVRADISARGLAAGYGDLPVWADASFQIEPGSFVALLGPNGAGKSTLVRLLLGLLPPVAGEVEVLGAPPRRGNPAIGYLPQGRHFDAELSIRGRDYVGLGLDGHRWGVPMQGAHRRRATDRVAAAVTAVDAEAYADRPIGRLSGGEQQRLHLAQALVGSPRILLLDEPLSNLDVRNQGAMTTLVADVARGRGLTVLLIAHDVNPLLPYIDQVMFVAQGKVTIGRPDDVINSQALSRIFDAPIEVLRDSRGRVFVVGLEEQISHPHEHPSGAE
jgi:zinc/manganese transport system ATP-binding protein